ncbi:sugar ABC transporter permease [Microbacterium sp. zg.Y1090]|uniref:carbohydrate ABC transporter permease n=1 Tax=Microbacterium wangruii TaxID=3049073 RepID=UPI00214B7094|nr:MULTISPECIES: sugar ABC transporter permease [unclassified Microbacterium]MCR2817538.1 sugar ABC transporter permease [Microbacterium sp. zg.Y1090]MDL5485819.1 sugar ABC transporter permease [Microbacterium sp. zg-Y1211]WIM28980.1 sugar ABC transporter permease [Microbacterium sp. zg-Y1090]
MTTTTIGPAEGTRAKRRSRISRGATPARALPLVPAGGLLLVFLAGPIVWALYGSLTDRALSGARAANPQFIGFDNYVRLFADPVLPLSIGITVAFVVGSAIIGQNVLGLLLAVLFRVGNRAVTGAVGVLVVTAWVLPEIVAAFIGYAFLSADGTLNALLAGIGIAGPNWLYAFPLVAIIVANTWRGTAFSMMIYRAALDDVPLEVIESSMIDGAGAWQRLRLITLPMIRPTIFTNLMLTTLQTLSVFTLIWVMTKGGPGSLSSTLPVLAYTEAFQFGDIGYGNAIAVVMLVLGAVFSIGYVVSLRGGGERP